MATVLIVVAAWLMLQPVVVLGWWALAERRRRLELARHRSLAGRLVAAASVTRFKTLLARPPAGPAQDALRSAQLRLMLDKTEPRA